MKPETCHAIFDRDGIPIFQSASVSAHRSACASKEGFRDV